jgi:hypothetical protein
MHLFNSGALRRARYSTRPVSRPTGQQPSSRLFCRSWLLVNHSDISPGKT